MNTSKHPGAIETVKDTGVAAIKGTGNIAQATVDTAAQVVTTTVKATKELAVGAEHAAAAVVGGAIKAAGEVASTTVNTVHNVVTHPISTDKAALKETEAAVAKN